MRGQEFGTPFSVTATGTARATATQSGTTNRITYITEVSASADLANLGTSAAIVIKQGTTTLWTDQMPIVGTGVSVYLKNFVVPLSGASGADVSVTVGTALSVSNANMAGYFLQ